MAIDEKSVKNVSGGELRALFGVEDTNRKVFEECLRVTLVVRNNELKILGAAKDVCRAEQIIGELLKCIRQGADLKASDVERAIDIEQNGDSSDVTTVFLDKVILSVNKRQISPKTSAQKVFLDSMRLNDMVFAIGPAGTGKTYLAMAMALNFLYSGNARQVILTRPAVEAGEKLGFLPGTLVEKVNPYLRPLYDALYDMMDIDEANKLVEKGFIEVAPLAYMRGRTLNNAFVILDEAQNTTREQMKMFLTRLGSESKTVVTGDITQVDLPSGQLCGLIDAQTILKGIKGIAFHHFSEKDVIRHHLVKEIIKAYDEAEGKNITAAG